jgi:phosphoglycolate phosphatase-like HAD superfamily hydrolase
LDKGIAVGIVSATYKQNLVDDFERLKFPYQQFFLIQGSDEIDFHKPDPAVFTEALKLLGEKEIEKKDIVYVGDSVDDCKAALAAGIDYIGLTTGLYSEAELKALGADKVATNIGDILNFIL